MEQTSAVRILTRNSNLKQMPTSTDANANALLMMSCTTVIAQRSTCPRTKHISYSVLLFLLTILRDITDNVVAFPSRDAIIYFRFEFPVKILTAEVSFVGFFLRVRA